MATRQYVGARYVPKFADPVEWDNIRSYEPLTIVQHLGNSFTSKIPVPAGVSIGDTKYWVNTGNYNAQINDLNEKVNAFISNFSEVNVKDYGAKGDGATDDTVAVKEAVRMANTIGKPIVFPTGNYVVRAEDIAVSVPIDFANSTVTVKQASDTGTVFTVYSEDALADFTVKETFSDNTKTTLGQLFGKSFSVLSPLLLGNRRGYDPVVPIYHQQCLCADGQGNYTNTKYSAVVVAGDYVIRNAQPITQSWVTIKNVTFDNQTNYNQQFIKVTRNNVIIDGVTITKYTPTSSGAVIYVENCANTVIRNIASIGQSNANAWGYVISMFCTTNTILENINTYNSEGGSWGVFGNDYVTNVTLRNSFVNRWDSHYEQFGYITIRDCVLTNNVNVGTGNATISIENSSIYQVIGREDIGGVMSGSITLTNCTIGGPDIFSMSCTPFVNFAAQNYTGLKLYVIRCKHTRDLASVLRLKAYGEEDGNIKNTINLNIVDMVITRINGGAFCFDDYGYIKELYAERVTLATMQNQNIGHTQRLIMVGCNFGTASVVTSYAKEIYIINTKLSIPPQWNGMSFLRVIGCEFSMDNIAHIEWATHAILDSNTTTASTTSHIAEWNNKVK